MARIFGPAQLLSYLELTDPFQTGGEISRLAVELLLLRAADHCAGALGLLSRPFSADRLIAAAERQTGLRAPDEHLHEPLRRLLQSFTEEADLSCVGRAAVRWDALRFLGNGLRLRAAEQQDRSIEREPIDRPIFITGLPRSGTTFLHRLMLEDAQNRAPLVWETIYPMPGADPDGKRAQVNRQLRTFERLAPEFRGLHPLTADSPQECSEIGAHVFRSYRFDSTFHVPSYRRWLDAEGSQEAYTFQRRFLQHLQHAMGPRRWVLKCPDHLFALHDLRAAFPDARIVFVHRDPVKVLLSLCKLTEVLRRPFSRTLDRIAIGRQESARWLAGTERMIRTCRASPFAEPICHVFYTDLVANPQATLAKVYNHFHLDLDDRTAGRVARLVTDDPNGGYGRHDYRFEDHGLNADAEREKFQPYMDFFDISDERSRGRAVAGAA